MRADTVLKVLYKRVGRALSIIASTGLVINPEYEFNVWTTLPAVGITERTLLKLEGKHSRNIFQFATQREWASIGYYDDAFEEFCIGKKWHQAYIAEAIGLEGKIALRFLQECLVGELRNDADGRSLFISR